MAHRAVIEVRYPELSDDPVVAEMELTFENEAGRDQVVRTIVQLLMAAAETVEIDEFAGNGEVH